MFKSKNHNLILSAILLLLIGSLAIFYQPKSLNQETTTDREIKTPIEVSKTGQDHQLIFRQATFSVELADTPRARTQGLSGREQLKPDGGLLFIFPQPNQYNFWMKDMKFAIDIVWLDQNWTIIDITENLTPETYPAIVTSNQPAQYVLEINAGTVAMVGLKIGDTATLTN